MLVSEMAEWLKTQDQDAVVQVVVKGGIKEFNPHAGEYYPEHWEYTDFRANRFVKETDEEYNMRYLLLGGWE